MLMSRIDKKPSCCYESRSYIRTAYDVTVELQTVVWNSVLEMNLRIYSFELKFVSGAGQLFRRLWLQCKVTFNSPMF